MKGSEAVNFNRNQLYITAVALMAIASSAFSGEMFTPAQALKMAFSRNPEIAASAARADSESSLVFSRSWLSNPKVGFMRETNMTNMQREMGPMGSWTVSQEILFPLKYFAIGKAQSARADAAFQEASDKKLEVRQRVLDSYYGVYAAMRKLALLEAQRETLTEIARVVEARRATGAVPQQDEMKAHVEQTKIEAELLLQSQEVTELAASLRALLNLDQSQELGIPKADLSLPRLMSPLPSLAQFDLARSKAVARDEAMLREARHEKLNANLGYLPDFMLSYKQAFQNAPQNAYSIGIEMTIPLWFFAQQTRLSSAAAARAIEAERNLEFRKRSTEAEIRSTIAKVEAFDKLLKIYETALVPQSTSTLNSSRAAYGAGRVAFQELLEAERTLYGTQISYYETLVKFVQSVTQLERITGTRVSTLPFEDTL